MLPPKEFKTVKQPEGSRLCGACVVAMAVGETLTYATDRMPAVIHKGDGRPYYRVRSIYAFLAEHGICPGLYLLPTDGDYWQGSDLDDRIEVSFRIRGFPALVAVKSDTFPDGDHWVFWDGENVRDPSPKVPDLATLDGYRIIEWTPLTYIDESNELP
jgi:hypothetical protein